MKTCYEGALHCLTVELVCSKCGILLLELLYVIVISDYAGKGGRKILRFLVINRVSFDARELEFKNTKIKKSMEGCTRVLTWFGQLCLHSQMRENLSTILENTKYKMMPTISRKYLTKLPNSAHIE